MKKEGLFRPKARKSFVDSFIGERGMNANALRDYFRPLETWLQEENARSGARVGWDHDDAAVMCSD